MIERKPSDRRSAVDLLKLKVFEEVDEPLLSSRDNNEDSKDNKRDFR